MHRADGSGLRDEAMQPSIRGASCIGRARARRLDGLSFFGPVRPAGPRNSASAETTCGYHSLAAMFGENLGTLRGRPNRR